MLLKNLFLLFKSNGLSSYQLGQINDNIFGKYESSFVTQLRLSQYDPLFGIWDSDKEKMETQIISK
ncbi:MAG: hypothetical protein CM15mP102_14950 [Flavobacteriales bacterium]|nr:MAG: hypothetical protein CM15mP102_14950 [Flavobacteriales bacterium]